MVKERQVINIYSNLETIKMIKMKMEKKVREIEKREYKNKSKKQNYLI